MMLMPSNMADIPAEINHNVPHTLPLPIVKHLVQAVETQAANATQDVQPKAKFATAAA